MQDEIVLSTSAVYPVTDVCNTSCW